MLTMIHSNFWQQTIRTKLSSPAHYTTYSLLRLRKGTLLARYTFTFFAFAISGFIHAMEDHGEGIVWQRSGSMRFFCTQAVGIMLEDTVQATYHAAVRRWGGADAHFQRLWTRVIGYSWVVIWMVWTSPAWFYPKLQIVTGSESDAILPFSFLRLLSEG